jgi:hypothetical protein
LLWICTTGLWIRILLFSGLQDANKKYCVFSVFLPFNFFGTVPYQCQYVNSRHILSLGNKPYACKLCDKSFANRGSLWVHNRRHEVGSKPYACSFCPKAGLEKTRFFLKKKHFKWVFLLVFLVFWVFLGFLYIFPEERVFRVFSVSRILLGASRR